VNESIPSSGRAKILKSLADRTSRLKIRRGILRRQQAQLSMEGRRLKILEEIESSQIDKEWKDLFLAMGRGGVKAWVGRDAYIVSLDNGLILRNGEKVYCGVMVEALSQTLGLQLTPQKRRPFKQLKALGFKLSHHNSSTGLDHYDREA
jgi:hypothetical protein